MCATAVAKEAGTFDTALDDTCIIIKSLLSESAGNLTQL